MLNKFDVFIIRVSFSHLDSISNMSGGVIIK